jgi:hypothetical protein
VNSVYNNFPWPESATAKQRATVEAKAQAVLVARQQFPAATLADLYAPLLPAARTKKGRRAVGAIGAASL